MASKASDQAVKAAPAEEEKETKTEEEAPAATNGDSTPATEEKEKTTESGTAESEGGDKTKLSGAAKKRFKWLVEHGHDPADARVLAQKPLDELLNEGDDSSDEEKEEKAQEGVEVIKVAIVPEDYPTTVLKAEQQKLLQEEVLNKIMEQKDESSKPKFSNSFQRAGSVMFTCVGSNTLDWLNTILEELGTKLEVKLKIAQGDDVPKTELMITNLPHSADEDNEKILGYLAAQNEDLNVGTWDIVKRTPQGPQGKSLQLIVSLDTASIEKLGKRDFKASYKFSQVVFKKKLNSAPKKPNISKGGKIPPRVSPQKRKNPPTKKQGGPPSKVSNSDSKVGDNPPKWHSNGAGNSRPARRPIRGGRRGRSIRGSDMDRDRSPPRYSNDDYPSFRSNQSLMSSSFSPSYLGGGFSQGRSYSDGFDDYVSPSMQHQVKKVMARRDNNKRKRLYKGPYRGQKRGSTYGPY